MESFKCMDIGINCPFETEARTEDKLMKKIERHARKVHAMNNISPDMMDKIKKAIKKS